MTIRKIVFSDHRIHVPQGCTLIFSYIRSFVGSSHFLGFKIFNSNIFGVFRKMNIFGDMKILWILFFFFFFFFGGGGSSHNWTIFLGNFYAFKGLFLRSSYRKGDIFLV